jgi:3-hydroxybutyryl-CoA dehydrogenase
MKKVLVLGETVRLEEFKKLNLQHAEVTYREYVGLDSLGDNLEEDEEEDDLIFEEDEDDEDDDTPMLLHEEDEIEEFATDEFDIVFDLNFDEDENSITAYLFNEGQVVIGCAVKRSLSQMIGGWDVDMECKVFGLNALPTFIGRPKLEMSMLDRADHMVLEATMKTLGLDYELIEDQVGMVTPRVVCMIINEAAFVLGEGTANVKAVDQAMKLGTNYPHGPFEWCDQIGVHNVVEVLEALQTRTGDGKYKIAPALLRQRDRDLLFYPER